MNGGDLSEEQLQVMSEVHLGCPPRSSGPHISRFTISLPPGVETSRYNELSKAEPAPIDEQLMLDEDGDLVLARRRKQCSRYFTLTIQHNITSTIPDVGLQVWKAELVLSDFVMNKMCTSSEFHGIVSLELGAGTGLVGILLACVAKTVFLTDHGNEILDNCAKNVHLNAEVFKSQGAVHVRELNWLNPWPPKLSLGDSLSMKRYAWNSSELDEVEASSVLVAADVIYNDDLTDAFFCILERLMLLGSEKVLYLALEKRYNFSLDDLDVVANGYSRFRSYIREVGESDDVENECLPGFVGKCMDLNEIPQYVREYNRGSDVEVWEIKYTRKKV